MFLRFSHIFFKNRLKSTKFVKMPRGQKNRSTLGQRMSENSYFLSPKCQRKSGANENMKTRLRRYSLDALDFMSSEKVSKFLHVKKFINGLKSRSNRSIEIWIQNLFSPNGSVCTDVGDSVQCFNWSLTS